MVASLGQQWVESRRLANVCNNDAPLSATTMFGTLKRILHRLPDGSGVVLLLVSNNHQIGLHGWPNVRNGSKAGVDADEGRNC
jgi:hypothetical protein